MPILQTPIQEISIWSNPTGNMFQRKMDEIFKDIFYIADDTLVVGYDSDDKDHYNTQQKYYKYTDR